MLKFVPYQSQVELPFWKKLGDLKVDKIGLSTEPIPLVPHFEQSQKVVFNHNSVNHFQFQSSSQIVLLNTEEEFDSIDKKTLIHEYATKIHASIINNNTSDLDLTLFLTYMDLKHHTHKYWVAFPTLVLSDVKQLLVSTIVTPTLSLESESVSNFALSNYFAYNTMTSEVIDASEFIKSDKFTLSGTRNIIWCFDDKMNTNNDYLGWRARNYLVYLSHHLNKLLPSSSTNSLPMIINVMPWKGKSTSKVYKLNIPITTQIPDKVTGWEYSDRVLKSKSIDIREFMDPRKQMEDSANLNIKLLKWRLLPNLDIEKMSSTKVLLLGSGTLGCHVSRNLMAWGVKHMTFVDNGFVSYSNPTRQTLYTFDDHNQSKAITAANALKKIYPVLKDTVNGYNMMIPMPNHYTESDESGIAKMLEQVEKLSTLVKEHDIVFLLTDNRESRWLPTVLALAHNKLLINVAIGYNDYVVMRHPTTPLDKVDTTGSHLGCYFCTDIVAPVNSLQNRTLDQQCTVTRPGVGALSSSLAVELLINIINANSKLESQLDSTAVTTEEESHEHGAMGCIPHQIRGNIDTFQTAQITTEAYDMCVACSSKVISEFKTNQKEFLIKSMCDKEYLEKMTGLYDMKKRTDEIDLDEFEF